MLTHKKPDDHGAHHPNTPVAGTALSPLSRKRRARAAAKAGDEEEGLTEGEPHGEVVWQVGDASDDEDGGEDFTGYLSRRQPGMGQENGEGERQRILSGHDGVDDEEEQRASTSSDATLARPDGDHDADFAKWEASAERSSS